MKKQIKITGIDTLVRNSVKFNKKSVTMPTSTWELIDTILKRITLKPLPEEK